VIDFSFEKRKNFPFNPIHVVDACALAIILPFPSYNVVIGGSNFDAAVSISVVLDFQFCVDVSSASRTETYSAEHSSIPKRLRCLPGGGGGLMFLYFASSCAFPSLWICLSSYVI
jgi:hypothetical protein